MSLGGNAGTKEDVNSTLVEVPRKNLKGAFNRSEGTDVISPWLWGKEIKIAVVFKQPPQKWKLLLTKSRTMFLPKSQKAPHGKIALKDSSVQFNSSRLRWAGGQFYLVVEAFSLLSLRQKQSIQWDEMQTLKHSLRIIRIRSNRSYKKCWTKSEVRPLSKCWHWFYSLLEI